MRELRLVAIDALFEGESQYEVYRQLWVNGSRIALFQANGAFAKYPRPSVMFPRKHPA